MCQGVGGEGLMAYRSVLYRKQLETGGNRGHRVSIDEGISLVKKWASMKADRSYKNGKKRKNTDQTVELVLHLGIDPKHADQMLRGAISLPKGLGKDRVVVAFVPDNMVDAARTAGAKEAGGDDLVEKVQEGWTDFDVAVAHPSMMGKVGKLGRILGPQGKMPTPKAGTVTPEVETAIKEFAAGRLEFRNDDGGNIHLPVGKTSFAEADLKENIEAVIEHMGRIKPAAAKGQYIRKACLCATRTPAAELDVA
jgi:large subunit ribosomal protein L1